MNIWKTKDELARHGRNGDTMIKKIDGDLAHVNPVEYEMSPEYIKEHGAGTINPITGKKEYFLGELSTGLAIGSSILKGFGAMGAGKDVAAGKTAAYDIYQEQLGLLGEQKDLAVGAAKSQYTTGMEELGLGTKMQATDIQTSGYGTMSQQNLATSPIEGKMQAQMKDLFRQKDLAAKKIADTRKLASAEADIRFRTGKDTIEASYQHELDILAEQPTTFLEGMFG